MSPSDIDNSHTLKYWTSNLCASKTLLGPRVILVDDIEGLEVNLLSTLRQLVRENSQFRIVLTCADIFAPPLKAFRDLSTIKLFRLNAKRASHGQSKLDSDISRIPSYKPKLRSRAAIYGSTACDSCRHWV